MSGETMHGYYAAQDVLPTYGGFATPADLAAHERDRRRLFTDKLLLPPRLFQGARLLEFGPDAGENSLVFALWGAECTLAEPNPRARPVIEEYFHRYGLEDRLAGLRADTVEGFPPSGSEDERYDVVDAEGFIYTVQPPSLWIERFARLTRAEGFVILFCMEPFSSLFELLWKVVQARYRSLTGVGAVEAARRLFAAKWASIPHKRTIESWTMDVLENPFVRLQYFLEPKDLCVQMYGAGFRLYSSWPRYDAGLDVHWFKRQLEPEEQLERELDVISRSRLSHVFGRKHFLTDVPATLDADVLGLLATTDALVDDFDENAAAACGAPLQRISELLASPTVLSAEDDRRQSLASVEMVGRLLELLAGGSPDEIVAFCNENPALISTWGMPSHFTIFRKT